MATFCSQEVFRLVDPKFGENNIYRYPARETVSLGPVMIATTARQHLPWIQPEVINENNYRKSYRGPLDEMGFPDHKEIQKSRKASFIGVSASMTTAVPRAIEIIRTYRDMPSDIQPKAIIVGGWHAGDKPEELLWAGADVIVHGEGELIIPNLLRALQNDGPLSEIPGISYWEEKKIKRNGPRFLTVPQDEMDQLPFPDFGLVRFAKIKIFPLQRTRGCSGKCRFCRVRSSPRSISPQKFLEQVEITSSLGGRDFFFVDDRSEEDREAFREVLRGLKSFRKRRKVEINITTQNRLTLGEDTETLTLMKEAGVTTVCIGFESPIAEELRAMQKPIDYPEKMAELAHNFKKKGLFTHAMMIFGYPSREPIMDENGKPLSIKKRAEIFWEFIKKIKPDTLQVLLYTPIPGTPDQKFLENQGRLYDFSWDLADGTHVLFQPDSGINPEELQEEAIKLMRKFYAYRRLLWRFGRVALAARALHLALISATLFFLWIADLPFCGRAEMSIRKWFRSKRIFRNAIKALQGQWIVVSWLKSFKDSDFARKLNVLATRNRS